MIYIGEKENKTSETPYVSILLLLAIEMWIRSELMQWDRGEIEKTKIINTYIS